MYFFLKRPTNFFAGYEKLQFEGIALEAPPDDGLDVYVDETFDLHIFR